MKLVLYGGNHSGNASIHEHLLNLSGKKNPKIVFIPVSVVGGEIEFYEFVEEFKSLGVNRFLYFPIDVPFDDIMLKEVRSSDIIFLGGGNTFYFLSTLRKVKFLKLLKEFVKKGGVLGGLSAGAIMMTPNIEAARYPSFDRDEEYELIRNINALNLAKFEFFPHYRNSLRYDTELKKRSKQIDYPIYACPDGAAVLVESNTLTFFGKIYGFLKGRKWQII